MCLLKLLFGMPKNNDESAHEICEELRHLRHEIKELTHTIMIQQSSFDTALAALTSAVTAAAAALAAGNTSTSTPDNVVNLFLSGVAAQTLALATATPPPGTGSTLAIVTQPVGSAVALGATLTLTVVATGNAPKYQWNLNGTPVASPSATTATLSVATAALTDAGSYTVTVTDPSGSVTSTPAVVTVA